MLRSREPKVSRSTIAVIALVLLLCASASAEQPTPVQWNLDLLHKPPAVTDAPITEPGLQGIFFEGLPYKGKPTRVFAWLGLPKQSADKRDNKAVPQKVPGMVLVHGGGGTAHARWVKLWNERGYAAIAMDTCGAGLATDEPKQKRLHDGGPPGWDASFDQIDWPLEDQWQYHAIADIMLANSLLRSLPDVDADKIGLTGISWGGYLTCIAAGADDRFKFAAPVYGCGFLGDDSAWKPRFEKLGPAQAEKWLTRWDPSVYLPHAKMPLLWVTGDRDFAYPLGSLQKSYRLPPGDRYLAIRHNMAHGHPPGETPPEILAFAEQHFADAKPLARLVEQGLEQVAEEGSGGSTAWAQIKFSAPITKAQIVVTKNSGPWQQREWTVTEALLDATSGRVSAAVPDGATAYYFMLFDERGCVASSEHVEVTATASSH
jgi:dienelactone hydrolase